MFAGEEFPREARQSRPKNRRGQPSLTEAAAADKRHVGVKATVRSLFCPITMLERFAWDGGTPRGLNQSNKSGAMAVGHFHRIGLAVGVALAILLLAGIETLAANVATGL